METITPKRPCVAPRLACLAVATLMAGAASPGPPDGVFCVPGQSLGIPGSGQSGRAQSPGEGVRILAVAPGQMGALRFGLSVWSPQGQNFSLFGTAARTRAGWLFAPDATCRLNITVMPDHGLSVALYTSDTSDTGANCREQGGAAVMPTGSLAFPVGSYEGRVTDQLANAEAFQRAGRCAGGH